MMKQVEWTGVYPAITTKFHKNDTLDFDTFLCNVTKQLESGIHGLVLAGSLGEASTLSNGEKDELLQVTLDFVNERIPVIMTVAEQTTKGAVAAAERAEKIGANGLMLLPPMRYKADSRETVAFLLEVAKATSLPIMIYNNPVDYGIEVTIEMFEELLKLDNIKAVKESTRDVSNIARLRNAFGDRLKILCGVDTVAMEELLLGADGWIAGLVSAFPRETVAIYELVKAGRIQEATKIYRWFMPLLELDLHPKLVQYIKFAEVATGLGSEIVRPPRLPLADEERERIKSILRKATDNMPALPILEPVNQI
jgi:dihydrodipicolinate synthase/N-acetylneuraminate lyase